MASIEKRTAKDGGTSYRVKVRLKGKPTQTASFERLTDAKKWAASIESAIREQRHFPGSEGKRRTLAELIDRYVKNVLPTKPKSTESRKNHLAWWRAELGAYGLNDITPARLAEARDKLASEALPLKGAKSKRTAPTHRSPATVNRYMASLSHAFTVAMNEWQWLDDNPLRRVSKHKEPRGRVRFLSDEERTRLLKACKESSNPYLYPVVVLALSTGARSAEIMGLNWDVIDLHRGRAILHETKNGERRALPITGHALELLKELSKVRRLDTRLLFPGNNPAKPVELRAPWLVALAAADIQDFRFHDLRHSAASALAMNGASLAEIAEVLGHKTLQMVKRYSHLSEGHTARVVESMNQKIFG